MADYTGLVRQFSDGSWGALCLELGLIVPGETERDVLKTMAAAIEFELECIAEGDPVQPATPSAIRDFLFGDEGTPQRQAKRRNGQRVKFEAVPFHIRLSAAVSVRG